MWVWLNHWLVLDNIDIYDIKKIVGIFSEGKQAFVISKHYKT